MFNRIISIAITLTLILTLTLTLTSCTSKSDIVPYEFEEDVVDVNYFISQKETINNYHSTDKKQQEFLSLLYNIITYIEEGTLDYGEKFKICFSQDECHSWQECCDYANTVEFGKSHLASYCQYAMYWGQKWLKEEITLKELCMNQDKLATIAFAENSVTIGKCYNACLVATNSTSSLVSFHTGSWHVYRDHTCVWQACVVIPC